MTEQEIYNFIQTQKPSFLKFVAKNVDKKEYFQIENLLKIIPFEKYEKQDLEIRKKIITQYFKFVKEIELQKSISFVPRPCHTKKLKKKHGLCK